MAVDPVSAGVEAGGSLLGGILGQIDWTGDKARAREMLRRASEAFNIPLPELQRMVAEQLGPSAMEGVSADPALQGQQYEALGELGRIADSGGMTLEDKVNYEDAQRQAAQQAMRQRQSILNLMRRSTGGNVQGASVAAQLGAVGDEQEATALAGAKTAADARRRATEAVLKRGALAGDVRGQQFDEAARRAAARDAVTRYNTTARQTAQNYNLGLPQEQFENQRSLAAGRSNTATNNANYFQNQADRTRGMVANAGTGVGQAAAGFIQPKQDAPRTSYDLLETTPDDQIDWGY